MQTNRTKCAILVMAPAVLTSALYVAAKPNEKPETAKTKIVVPVKSGDIPKQSVGKAANQVAIGEQFRLWFSVNATDCNDPIFAGNAASDDHRFEAYGELKVDGKSHWKMARQFAHQFHIRHLDLPKPLEVDPRKQGFTLNANPQIFMDKHEILFNTDQGSIARIALKLTDKDDPDSDDVRVNNPDRYKADKKDDLIGDFNIDLDLSPLGASDGHYYWGWSGTDGTGNKVGTNLYLFAEHVKTIYGTKGQSAPIIQPKILDKKLPGKVGGPGPVVSKSNSKQAALAKTK